MLLTTDRLAEWIALAAPKASEEERAAILARRRAEIGKGEFDVAEVIVALDGGGAIAVAVRLSPLSPGTGWLGGLAIRGGYGATNVVLSSLVREAVERAGERGLHHVHARPIVGSAPPEYAEALLAAGFRSEGERVEFKADLAALPGDAGSPIAWRTMAEVGKPFAAEMLRRASAPDSEEASDPAAAIDEWLSALDLRKEPECVQVGYVAGEPVAFVCAQVNPSDGWSRITHMGLAVEARGKGLGRWVHRRGFQMLKAQGGRLYHGGTAASNARMVRLFEAHGCRLAHRMECFVRTEPPVST